MKQNSKIVEFPDSITSLLQAMQKTNKSLFCGFATEALSFNRTEGATYSRSRFFHRSYSVLNRFFEAETCRETLRIDVDRVREEPNFFKITFCKIVGKELQRQQTLFFENAIKSGFIEDGETKKVYTFSFSPKLGRITGISTKAAKIESVKKEIRQKY